MDTILSATGISKTFRYRVQDSLLQDIVLRRRPFGHTKVVPVLHDAHLHVKRGEWIGIYAPNGAGKTTLLRILAGLLPPDSGYVRHGSSMSLFLGLGVGFDMQLPAKKNIYLDGLLRGFKSDEINRFTDRVLEFSGVAHHQDMPLKYYSSGMLLRLAYAIAAQAKADIYLFDEVLAVGDAAFKQKCTDQLNLLRGEGSSAVLVSHSLPQLKDFCDRIETIKQGRIVPFVEDASSAKLAA